MAGANLIPQGAVLICPKCYLACRVGSDYFLSFLGQCGRCKVPMVDDMDASRVARRNRLYTMREMGTPERR